MLKGISDCDPVLTVVADATREGTPESTLIERISEAVPGAVSLLIILAPLWLTYLDPSLGLLFVTAFLAYFLLRGILFGVRAVINRKAMLVAVETDWLDKLEQLPNVGQIDWRSCRVTFLIRAFREGNEAMLRDTIASIYSANWPRQGSLLRDVEVVFATEEHDPITPPLVELLAAEFRNKVVVRQVLHPYEQGKLPGPSTAMHFVGRILYRDAVQQRADPENWLVADLDADTLVHPQYLACLVYRFVTERHRQRRVFQPIVAFTTDYWHAPLHSRLSAIGTTALTVSWHRKPEIAFTGAAASLALLKSVDFWPTNSHSQDSGLDLRLRIRYGRRYAVVGLPVPMSVYPVMAVGDQGTRSERARAYIASFKTLFRQSARWREGPMDEFVEAARYRRPLLMAHRLWNGIERDTVTIMPGYGYLAAGGVINAYHPNWNANFVLGSNDMVSIASMVALSFASLLGLIVFWQLMHPVSHLVDRVSARRRLLELVSFWLVFGFYIPVLTGVAGIKTASTYMIGRRPRGHFVPTPK